MIRQLSCIVLLALTFTACDKPPTVQPSSQGIPASPDQKTSTTNLVASMSDEQILRAIGHDPATLTSHRTQGKDGYSMDYTNATIHVSVTRSVVSGITVLRWKPEAQKQEWSLGKP